MADIVDSALTHLIESHENLEDAREEHPLAMAGSSRRYTQFEYNV